MTKLLTPKWLTALESYEHLFIGFSGGLDSSVLLHALAATSLHSRLIAVHVHHGISANANVWKDHCQQICKQYHIRYESHVVQIARLNNLEERARKARYEIFSTLVGEKDALLLAHHQDDQAETLLLQLFRGAGVDGLAAMADFSSFSKGWLLRPLLSHTRAHLQDYALAHQLQWIEDESNTNESFSRNFVRHQLLPQIQTKWPAVVGNLARTALHCQQAQFNLDSLAKQDAQYLTATELLLTPLLYQPIPRLSNVLRVWLRNNQVRVPSTAIFTRIIQEVIFARSDAIPEVAWGDIIVRRYQNTLYLENKTNQYPLDVLPWLNFPKPLFIEVLNLKIETTFAKGSFPSDAVIEIRWRQGGERLFWHGKHQSLKKLFQQWQVPPWRRAKVPLLYVNDVLMEVIGYAKV